MCYFATNNEIRKIQEDKNDYDRLDSHDLCRLDTHESFSWKSRTRGLSWSVRQFSQELGGDTTAYHIKGNCWQGVAETLGTSPSLLALEKWISWDEHPWNNGMKKNGKPFKKGTFSGGIWFFSAHWETNSHAICFFFFFACAVLLGILKISQTHAMNHGNFDEPMWWIVVSNSAVNLWILGEILRHVLPNFQDLEGESIKTSKLSWATQFFASDTKNDTKNDMDRLDIHGPWIFWRSMKTFLCQHSMHFFSKTTEVDQGWLNPLIYLIDFLSWKMGEPTSWNWPVLVGVDDFFGAVPLASKMTRRDTSVAISQITGGSEILILYC